MKAKTTLVLAASALLVLTSCGGGNSSSSSQQTTSGEATTSQAETTTSQGGGDTSQQTTTTEEGGDLPYFKDQVVTEPSLVIHYFRLDDDYSNSSIWCWAPDGDGTQYLFEYCEPVHNEHIAVIPVSGIPKSNGLDSTYGIIFRGVKSWDWQTKDIMVDFSQYELVNGNAKHVYFIQDDETPRAEGIYEVADAIKVASFRNEKRVRVETSNVIDYCYLYENGIKVSEKVLSTPSKAVLIDLPKVDGVQTEIDFNNSYLIEVHFVETDAVLKAVPDFYNLYSSDKFNNLYAYEGDDLGAVYSRSATSFKVWSPFAKSITLRVYTSGTPVAVDSALGDDSFDEYEMVQGEKGVWAYSVDGDLHGKYYTYFVKSEDYPDGKEIVDPYAKSCGVNGLRGMVLDFSRTNPEGWDDVQPIDYDRKELTVYETHLVDPTMGRTWTNNEAKLRLKGTYRGFIEEGTTYTENDKTVPTGYDHIKSLGVNAVQLQPIFDQANDEVNKTFNWGYNPLNYNCLEGAYSVNPYNGATRVSEFKELVKKLNRNGMNVIMDVVYNHVNSVNGENFDVLCPHYYFRYTNNQLSNGSGCGNETASENFMFAKFMKESALFWAKEYKLGGFRFDLMALHNLKVMEELTEEVQEATFDNFAIYGEPWTGGTSPLPEVDRASQANLKKFNGYGAFNDLMRDGLIKSGMNSVDTKGWASVEGALESNAADAWAIANGIKGWTSKSKASAESKDPNKAVQYASCHDNYTLFDRLTMAYSEDKGKTTSASPELLHYGPMLANGLVFVSNGTTFMLSGEEFLRTKTKADGTKDGNSYNASYEENALDYSLAIKNADVVDFYRTMISFKRYVHDTHLEEEAASALKVNVSEDFKVITAELSDGAYTYLIAARNGTDSATDVVVDFTGYSAAISSYEPSDGAIGAELGRVSMRPFEFRIGMKLIN